MAEPQVSKDAQLAIDRINLTRKVLHQPDHTGQGYVDTYNNYWAEHYNVDSEHLGFMSWEHGAKAIAQHKPSKDATILDYNGGTGQCGKRLAEMGYKDLHVSDGSPQMLAQAMKLGVYKQAFLGTTERDVGVEYLRGIEKKYDAILCSMGLAEFRPLTEQIVCSALKVGGVFISLEAVPHIEKSGLTGIQWLLAEQGKDDRWEIVVNDDNLPHDKFTDDKMKLLVVRRLK